ncbi:MAG: hypothetical protein LQ346_006091 [Caloplaca aetnensis]|nr:MAG: hypothetical protein LQ346_006091 [Caloplaca aetnensis]
MVTDAHIGVETSSRSVTGPTIPTADPPSSLPARPKQPSTDNPSSFLTSPEPVLSGPPSNHPPTPVASEHSNRDNRSSRRSSSATIASYGTVSENGLAMFSHQVASPSEDGFQPSPSLPTSPASMVGLPPKNDIVAWRRICKNRLLDEARGWTYAPNERDLKKYLCFDDHDDAGGLKTPTDYDIYRDWRRYEGHATSWAPRHTMPIQVYGTPGLYPLDRLKFWVNLNMHLCHPGQPWPPGYKPQGFEHADKRSGILSSVFVE